MHSTPRRDASSGSFRPMGRYVPLCRCLQKETRWSGSVLRDQIGNFYSPASTGKLLWKRRVDDQEATRLTGSAIVYREKVFVPVSSWEESRATSPGTTLAVPSVAALCLSTPPLDRLRQKRSRSRVLIMLCDALLAVRAVAVESLVHQRFVGLEADLLRVHQHSKRSQLSTRSRCRRPHQRSDGWNVRPDYAAGP